MFLVPIYKVTFLKKFELIPLNSVPPPSSLSLAHDFKTLASDTINKDICSERAVVLYHVRLIFQECTVKTYTSQLLCNLHEFIIHQNKSHSCLSTDPHYGGMPRFRKPSIYFPYPSCHLVSLLMEIVIFI